VSLGSHTIFVNEGRIQKWLGWRVTVNVTEALVLRPLYNDLHLLLHLGSLSPYASNRTFTFFPHINEKYQLYRIVSWGGCGTHRYPSFGTVMYTPLKIENYRPLFTSSQPLNAWAILHVHVRQMHTLLQLTDNFSTNSHSNFHQKNAQLSQRDRAAGCVSFGQK